MRVQQGSPADEANFRGSYQPVIINGQELLVGDDVIVAIDDQTMAGFEDLSAFMQQAEPGQEVVSTLLRDGNEVEVLAVLGDLAGYTWLAGKEDRMSEHIEHAVASHTAERSIPAKCAQCPYLDTEHDPLSGTIRLYCQAPWWKAKRWFCALPTGVSRA